MTSYEKSEKRTPYAVGPVNITLPKVQPTLTIVSPATAVRVEGTAQTSSALPNEVRATVYRALDAVPNMPPAVGTGVGEATVGVLAGANFTFDAVPHALCNSAGHLNNKVAVWAQFGTSWEPPAVVAFKGQCQPVTATILATNCLWFAWADSGFVGPEGETGEEYRPVKIDVPGGANKVTITALPGGFWKHDPNDATASDADGRSTTRPLEKNGYRDASLNSLAIQTTAGSQKGGVDTNLNKLVGAWHRDLAGTTPADDSTPEIVIGNQITDLPVPTPSDDNFPSPSFLYLGFHDGFQWNNNDGSVDVEITWSH